MDKSQALLQKASRLHQAGQHTEAERLYRKLLKTSPGNLQARVLLATLRAQRGDLSSAINDFSNIIRRRPDMLSAHLNLATALSSSGRHQDAAVSYRKVIELDANSVAAHYGLACSLLACEAFDEAEAQFLHVRRLDPQHLGMLVNLGTVYKQQGQLEAAASYYIQALAINPGFAEIHSLLAQVRLDEQDYPQAKQLFQRALELGQRTLTVYIGLGDVAKAQGDTDTAIKHYRTATTLDPDSQYAYLRLDRALLNQGEEKQQALKRLLENHIYRDWNEPREITRTLAQLYEYPDRGMQKQLQQLLDTFDPGQLYTAAWWMQQLRGFGDPLQGHDTLLRGVFSAVYSWSLPCAEALDAIAGFAGSKRIYSYGAGTAYWERLLSVHCNATVTGSDLNLGHRFMDIGQEDYGMAKPAPEDVILISWIPAGNTAIDNIIANMQPEQKLVLVGEPPDATGKARICATVRFFASLARDFEHVQSVDLPTFSHMHDNVQMFTKNCRP